MCRLLPVALLLPALLRAAPAPAPGWPAGPAALDALVAEAWQSNLALAGETLEVERAAIRLAAVRSQLFPRLDLTARYSLADGGRTIDFPVGDLLNDAYATLNQYLAAQGQPARFSSVANQSIPLLRDREQETRLRLTQPLYAPELSRSVAAARAGLAARAALTAAFRRQLRAEVQEAWLRHHQAVAVVAIHESALGLVTESLRVNRALAAQDRVTADVVLRAEAEWALVQQQVQEAAKDRDLARSYLNFLLNRPLRGPLDTLESAEAERWAGALSACALPGADASGREELLALDREESAARASTSARRARQRPTLALAVEGGIQGESYRTGPGYNYTLGSLVLEWNLFDGRQRNQEVATARLDERQVTRRREEAARQFDLQLQQIRDEFLVARTGLAAARLRREAAREAHRLVTRREAEGLASQITVLDSRNTLTAAELNYEVTRTRLLIAGVRLDRSSALTSLP